VIVISPGGPAAQLVTEPAVHRGWVGRGLQHLVKLGLEIATVTRVHQVEQAVPHQLGRGVGKDPLGRGALEPDDPLAIGDGHDVRRMVDQGPEMLLALAQAGGLDLQLAVQRHIVGEHDELAHHHEERDHHQPPEQEGLDRAGDQVAADGDGRRRGDRDVREELTPPARQHVAGAGSGDRDLGGAQGGQGNQHVAGHPPGVDRLGRAVGVHRGQVGKAAVREEVRQQSGRQ
jgi:hypothetical protein